MTTTIQRIDKGLGELYTKQGRDDYYPNGEHKPGLFSEWCDEQGFDETDVIDELQHPADTCTLVDYCNADDFPFSFEIKAENDAEADIQVLKQNEIYKILKILSVSRLTKGKIKRDPNHKYPHPKNIKLHFEQNDFKQSVDIYTKHVYHTLGFHGIHEQSLMNLLTVSRVNNGFPYLRYMVDSFQRDRVKYNFDGTNCALSLNDWFLSNTYCQNLSKRDPNKAEELKQAIVSYCNRIAPNFQFAPEVKINDSIKLISQYLVAATRFISKISAENGDLESVLPFQCDVVIRFYGVVDNIGTVTVQSDENKHDSESDDEGNDTKADNSFDYVGDVKNKIKQEKLVHLLDSIPHQMKVSEDNETSGDEVISRYMMRTFRNFSRKVHDDGKYQNNGHDDKHDDDEAEADKHGEKALKWPNRRRFCAFIDRKDAVRNNNDDLLFFEPPKDAKVFPMSSEFVSEWHFENVRKCIIPRIGYKNGKNEKDNLEEIRKIDAKERAKKVTITSAESCHGQIGTFSFHVTQRDEISCYFFWEGQILRFYPQDILDVFPFIFVDKVQWRNMGDVDGKEEGERLIYNNKEFTTSLEGKKLAQSMIIQDFQFESWYCDLCENDDFPKYNN